MAVTHGAQSAIALAPTATRIKKSVLARMQLRQSALDWQGRETLELYCRAKAKLQAIDIWLESHEAIRADGSPAPVLQLYFRALHASARALSEFRAVIRDMAQQDDSYAAALRALQDE